MKACAAFFGSVHFNVSSMCDDCILHNRQSESCSARFAAAPLVYTVKPVEDTGLVFDRDAYTIVCDIEMPIRTFMLCGECYGGAIPCIRDGIICKIAEYAV